MKFREWLPITGRNRFALGLAALSAVMFFVWNFVPVFTNDGEPLRSAGVETWPEVFLYQNYLSLFRNFDFEELMVTFIIITLPLNACLCVLLIPLWQILHASPYIRIPLAFICLIGGIGAIYPFFTPYGPETGTGWRLVLSLIGLSMITNAMAFFLFKNELALREERARPNAL